MSRSFSARCGSLGASLVVFAIVVGSPRLGAVDFIRGDANGDQAVSMADAHYLLSFLFRGTAPPECMSSADVNDNGRLDISDSVGLMYFLILGGDALPPPFPGAGADPTPDEDPFFAQGCDSYGSGAPLEDAEARLTVIDAASTGPNGKVSVRIAVSSSTTIAGFSGDIRLPAGLAAGMRKSILDLTGTHDGGFAGASLDGDVVRFGFLTTLTKSVNIPAGSREAVELTLCLSEGAPAGDYPLELLSGELVDWESGRAIAPALESGTLSVTTDVIDSVDCNPPPAPPCGGTPPVDITFKMADVSCPPGGEVAVPFLIHADAAIQAYSFSVDFDETLVEVAAVERVWQKPAGADPDYGFFKTEFDNRDDEEGNSGILEGFIIGAAVFDFQGPVTMPPNTDNEALRFHLRVRSHAPDGNTTVGFLDGGKGSGQPVKNVITACGTSFAPDTAGSFLFVNCHLNVLPDITSFVRGDANGDGVLEISDASTTLNFLFSGIGTPHCFDAADTNDDGRIDITDPIYGLTFQFLGGAAPPAPFPDAGRDPTNDGMGCLTRSS